MTKKLPENIPRLNLLIIIGYIIINMKKKNDAKFRPENIMEQSIITIGKENDEKMEIDEYQITAFDI